MSNDFQKLLPLTNVPVQTTKAY